MAASSAYFLLAWSVSACSGAIGGAEGHPDQPPLDEPPPVVYEPGDRPLELPQSRIWRLAPLQYERAFEAAFGMTAVRAEDFPEDPRRDGYDDIASQNQVDITRAILVQRNADRAGQAIAAGLSDAQPCLLMASPTADCVRRFVAQYTTAAFRRSPSDSTLDGYAELHSALLSQGSSPADAASAVIEAIAQSPLFLYRTEIGEPAGDSVERLDSATVASQLAFMLTDSPPDEALMADAATDALQDRSVVLAHAQRLLMTPEAKAKVTKFFDQYLGIYTLTGELAAKDPEKYPEFTAEVQQSMVEETHRFVDRVIFGARGTLVDLFTSDQTWLDDSLRAYYGWPDAASPDAAYTVAGQERAGVFMHGSVLTARAASVESDPLHRGLFIYRDLLCKTIGPPDDLDINSLGNLLDSPDPEDTERQRFEFLQRNSPSCASCHELFLPLGLSLETFDAVGVFREEEHGRPLLTHGELRGSGDQDGEFSDAQELFKRIGESVEGQACFAQHWSRFAFGSADYSVPVSSQLLADFRDRELGILELMLLITQDDAFYLRRAAEEE